MTFEPITLKDLDKIKNLQPEDWPDIIPDIEMYIRSPFCFPIKACSYNKTVGIGASIAFEHSGWLAHVIVHPDYRNQGIGLKIVKELMKILKKTGATTYSLIATELGHPIYLKAGFKDVIEYAFYKREAPWIEMQESSKIYPFRKDNFSQIIELDKKISGENRANLLANYIDNTMVYINNGEIDGFYIPGLKEGPIFADNEEAGLALMQLKYLNVDKAVLPAINKIGIQFLLKNDFIQTTNTGIRMIYGKPISWQPQKVYSRIGGNFG